MPVAALSIQQLSKAGQGGCLPVSLFDFILCSIWLDAERIVELRLLDHVVEGRGSSGRISLGSMGGGWWVNVKWWVVVTTAGGLSFDAIKNRVLCFLTSKSK